MEKFADELDMAQVHTERELQLRIDVIQRHANAGLGRTFCIDCGELIPESRRQHVPNAQRCAHCQDRMECSRSPVRRSAA
ncbi:TraR/DksA C4-type zinc finger protein [Halochromatium glycolicum]|jgi:phage/conjugal plasmid C-4 type zinc finger TraR family protein|uniref:Molecular chaperone DnaK n=1 Tax=Halochromatium glycolicum TaxID=85075 RepID=A0AAJ0U3A0_9GAMM|nr:TraR/DksA C4-type zinc finger protein [Halochromatium glycolicum]MBK1704501.1 molecular chaperone DnaK [Halochromatium glycolicum]